MCVIRQASIGLVDFLISCPITLVHLLIEDISLFLGTVCSFHAQTHVSLCAVRILCLGGLAGYLGEGHRYSVCKAMCLRISW